MSSLSASASRAATRPREGRWIEQLFMRVALQEPEFEIDGIWLWPDWPEHESLTGLDGCDIGIDLVARRTSGGWVAIQCKRYDDRHVVGKGGSCSLSLMVSQESPDRRWCGHQPFVTPCDAQLCRQPWMRRAGSPASRPGCAESSVSASGPSQIADSAINAVQETQDLLRTWIRLEPPLPTDPFSEFSRTSQTNRYD